MYRLLFVVFCFIVIQQILTSGDIQIRCDDTTIKRDNLFRIDKLNLIYNKAKNSLGEAKLKNLRTDFFSVQQDEITLKKLKSNNQDKDGLHEAAVRRKLLNVLSKYGLDKYYHDLHPPVADHDGRNARKARNLAKVTDDNPDTDIHLNQKIFRDSRLDKLWKKAEKSGFSQEELMILQEEFQHQQDRLDEHHDVMNMLDAKSDDFKVEKERWENSIENTMEDNKNIFRSKSYGSESASDKKHRTNQNVHQMLQDKQKETKKGFEHLHAKIKSKLEGDVDFDEQKVIELWSSAQTNNFTSEELDELKTELYHYQTRIKKLRHYEVQLEHGQVGSDPSKDDDQEVKSLKKRVKDMNHKIAKVHKLIENKIISKRIEL